MCIRFPFPLCQCFVTHDRVQLKKFLPCVPSSQVLTSPQNFTWKYLCVYIYTHMYVYMVCVCMCSHVCSYPTDIWYLSPLVCLVFLGLIPLWVVVARQSPQIREVLRSGWQPVIVAMSISRYALKQSLWSRYTLSQAVACLVQLSGMDIVRALQSSEPSFVASRSSQLLFGKNKQQERTLNKTINGNIIIVKGYF